MVKEPGRLLEKSASELVKMSYSESILEAAIGIASINSLIEIDEEQCVDLNAGNLIAEKGKGKRIAIVGHFPFIPKLRESAKQLWVIEKNPREGDSPEDMASDLIHGGTVTQITSCKQ